MKISFLRQRLLDSSIFVKILLVIISTAVLVNIVVSLYFRAVMSVPMDSIYKLLGTGAELIFKEMKTVGDMSAAQKVGDDFGMMVRYQGKMVVGPRQRTFPFLTK